MEPATAGLSALAIEVALEDLLASSVPLLAVVDDAHWLDEVSARMIARLAGAARDLGISVLLAARPEGFSGYGVTEVAIQGLDSGAAAMLVRQADPDLAPGVVAELVEATAGNPLGLLELPRALTSAQRAGAEPVASAAGVTSRLVAAFGDRIRRLPAGDRLAVIARPPPTRRTRRCCRPRSSCWGCRPGRWMRQNATGFSGWARRSAALVIAGRGQRPRRVR